MATTRLKRPLASRTNAKTEKDVATLADRLASRLKVTEDVTVARKPPSNRTKLSKVAASTPEENRLTAMRSVNSVLQSLTSAVQSGWKASSARTGSSYNTSGIALLATTARASLSALRRLDSRCVDVEKAALSVVGKLLALEMLQNALEILTDAQPSISTLYENSGLPHARQKLQFLLLPLPTLFPIEPALQSLTSTYLIHAQSIAVGIIPSKLGTLNSYLGLIDEPGCFASWMSFLPDIPEKTIASLIKRYYIALTTTLTAPPALPSELLRVRLHALRALLLSAEPLSCSFWEQCLKFAATYAKSSDVPESEAEKSIIMLECFGDVLKSVEARPDSGSMMSGKGWIMFCEYWLSLAKRAGDSAALNKAASYIRNAASSSCVSSENLDVESTPSPDSMSLLVSRASASFVQTCALLESKDCEEGNSDLPTSINACLSCLEELRSMVTSRKLCKLERKLRRSLEKLRKACAKLLVANSRTSPDQARVVIEAIVKLLENVIELGDCEDVDHGDHATSALDSLFTLTTSVLNPQRHDTCDKAFDYLAKGSHIIDLFQSKTSSSTPTNKRSQANYTRCLSGAFFNVAATLYKADKYGFAIRFLLQACPLAAKAIDLHSHIKDGGYEKGKTESEEAKDAEVWKVHENQLHRRWELLAICYSKTNERKLAQESFVRGVTSYPFTTALAGKGHSCDDLLNSETHKQVCAMIDRLTYIGASEILLGERTSLLQPLRGAGVSDLAIGAVITRQIRSLDDSRWKPLIQKVIGYMLDDLLTVYTIENPVLRSKALIWQLEHFYYSETNGSSIIVIESIEEIRRMLKDKTCLHNDAYLAHLCPYLLALANVWNVLHAHRLGEPVQNVKQMAEEFLNECEMRFYDADGQSKGHQASPESSKSKKSAAVPLRKGRTPAAARKPATIRPTRKNPVTPKPRKSLETKPKYVASPVVLVPGPSECRTLIRLLAMLSELLGVLGFVLQRMRTLSLGKLLAEKTADTDNDSYAYLCSALAHDLLCIGKYAQSKALMSTVSINSRKSSLPNSSKSLLYLRQAEILAFTDGPHESLAHYEEANRVNEGLLSDEGTISTSSRIRERVTSLERTSLAAGVFALIQDMKGDLAESLKANLQRLRLLNKATELLSRLSSGKKPESVEENDPFAMSDLKDALPVVSGSQQDFAVVTEHKSLQRGVHAFSDGQEWRIASSLLETMHALCRLYFIRGSVREAEYFADQAEQLSRALQSPIQIVQALLLKSEIYLYLGQIENSEEKLGEAMRFVSDPDVLAFVDAKRMKGNQLQKRVRVSEAAEEYNKALNTITDTEAAFKTFDNLVVSRRKSDSNSSEGGKAFLPLLQAAVLKEKVWLKRDDLDDEYTKLLQQLMSLPQLPDILASVHYLLVRLSVYDIHDRFRSDMSLNSLAESIIALPMGMTRENSLLPAPSQEVQEALDQADDLLSEGLKIHAGRNNVVQLRNIAVSGALLSIYQASLGNSSSHGPALAVQLLDMGASVTIHRELLDAISFKFSDLDGKDDTVWPSGISEVGKLKENGLTRPSARNLFAKIADDSDEEDCLPNDVNMRKYWEHVSKKHQTSRHVAELGSSSEIDSLPTNWTVISISLTEDKNALLVSRQVAHREPIVFCIPLRNRREEEEAHFTYDDAVAEFKDIIQASDEGTRKAHEIQSTDKDGKAAWWSERKQLNQRLKELLDNIEFCWLGAFKGVLREPMRMPPDALSSIRTSLQKVFKGILGSKEKKSQRAKLKLDDGLLELFATLPPNCRDEELEDVIYFVLDLYHFHGVSIALAEVDVDVVAVDLRTALEEYHARMKGRIVPELDAHTFLVLDKNMQPFPWESMSVLRDKSVSRVPSLGFITDRLALARFQRGLSLDHDEGQTAAKVDRPNVDLSKGYFVLNPGGDLVRTEERFRGWVNDMRRAGWDGVVGAPPSELQFLNALERRDLVVYFGHAGAEQYVRSHKIRHLPRCAATMLWGCSSGELRDMGDFDRIGTPNNYMIAGCPTLVANLWDVTDRDIDKFALAVFDKMNIHPKEVEKWKKGKKKAEDGKMSIAAAVAQSRDSCKLNYLNGAAVVVYGIPFYL